jgi:2-keto-4-pentenoate hydratase/2-oxohepta-3-ene-1,7-dioic acid hydratase in catechol pathway
MDKIICLGKNYSEHTKEMQEPAPAKPVLFLKPPSVLIEPKENARVRLPWHRGLIHHECEVVLKLYKKNVIAVGVGLDLTLREVQKELKTQGHPWEISKVFTNSAIISNLKGLRDFSPNWTETVFSLKVNGQIRQEGRLIDATMNPNEMIHYIDQYFPLEDGDLVFTGTPQGVGPLNPGDNIEMRFGLCAAKFTLVE